MYCPLLPLVDHSATVPCRHARTPDRPFAEALGPSAASRCRIPSSIALQLLEIILNSSFFRRPWLDKRRGHPSPSLGNSGILEALHILISLLRSSLVPI